MCLEQWQDPRVWVVQRRVIVDEQAACDHGQLSAQTMMRIDQGKLGYHVVLMVPLLAASWSEQVRKRAPNHGSKMSRRADEDAGEILVNRGCFFVLVGTKAGEDETKRISGRAKRPRDHAANDTGRNPLDIVEDPLGVDFIAARSLNQTDQWVSRIVANERCIRTLRERLSGVESARAVQRFGALTSKYGKLLAVVKKAVFAIVFVVIHTLGCHR